MFLKPPFAPKNATFGGSLATGRSQSVINFHIRLIATSLLHGRILLLLFAAHTPGKRILYVFTDTRKKTSQPGIRLPSFQALPLTYSIYSRPIHGKLLSVSFFLSNFSSYSSVIRKDLRLTPTSLVAALNSVRYGVKGVSGKETQQG